jgi:hypothetical protein
MTLTKNAEDGCAAAKFHAMTRCRSWAILIRANPSFVSQKMFLIIDLRSTLDVLKAAEI